eukprot:Rhum_TRINITY_DN7556_c0_g1::Rhum_TRINITY_DN7556_c0_g1_i1::g.23482::m.23482
MTNKKSVYLVRHGARADFTSMRHIEVGSRRVLDDGVWDTTWPECAKTLQDPDVDVRHAPLPLDEAGTCTPMWRLSYCDAPLTPEGRGQARACGMLVPKEARVYSSPFLRCRETAHHIIATQGSAQRAVIDTGLTEHLNKDWFDCKVFEFFGRCHKPRSEDVVQTLYSGHRLEPEDAAAYKARAVAVYDTLRAMSCKEPVVLVTHGGFVHNFLAHHTKVTGEPRLDHDKRVQYADVYPVNL